MDENRFTVRYTIKFQKLKDTRVISEILGDNYFQLKNNLVARFAPGRVFKYQCFKSCPGNSVSSDKSQLKDFSSFKGLVMIDFWCLFSVM